MFERVKQILGEVRRMFAVNEVKKIFGDVELTGVMVRAIEQWNKMITGSAPWLDGFPSLGIESGICREFADIAVNEMEASVDNEIIDERLSEALKGLNENLQDGLALGSFAIKPFLDGSFEFVGASDIIPIKFDKSGKLTDVAFVQRKKKSDREYLYRVERHTLDDRGLTISNRAFKGTASEFGIETNLSAITDWAELPEEVTYPGMAKMDFGYYKNPMKNHIDITKCGVSVYANAVDLIKRADIQGARIDWEYESGERAIHVDERALKKAGNKVSMAKLSNRLYRGLNLDQGNGELLKEYSPTMRDSSFREGLEDYLRRIEFNVGLAYGDLSNANYVEKTATEIKSAKQRKYNRVCAIQENLKACLEELVDAIAFYSAQYTTKYTFTCTFSDSILADEEAERNQDRQDVSMGVMSLEEYRAKWYGEDIETAKANLPEQNSLVLDNLPPAQ